MTELETESDQSTGPMEDLIPKLTEQNQKNQITEEKNELKIELNADHIAVIKKQYKYVKKYMSSAIYKIRFMDGTEKTVNELLDKYNIT